MNLSKEQKIQEDEYFFPYHYLDLISPLNNFEYIAYLSFVKSFLPLNGERILDFGCGDGRFEYLLKDSNCKIFGVDYSKKAISFARAFNKTPKFFEKNIYELNFSEKFDFIVSIETLEHIPFDELEGIIKKISMLLKTKGKFIISVPSKNIPLSKKHYQHFDERNLRELLSPFFIVDSIKGISVIGFRRNFFRFLKLLARFLELIFPSSSKKSFSILRKIYFKQLDCSPSRARRLVAICSKKPR